MWGWGWVCWFQMARVQQCPEQGWGHPHLSLPPIPCGLSRGRSSTVGPWQLQHPQPTPLGRGHFYTQDVWQQWREGQSAEERQQGTVLLTERTPVAKRAPRRLAAPYQVHWLWPLRPLGLPSAAAGRKAGAAPGPRSKCSLLQLSPSGSLPGPVWAPSQGQVGVHCPHWARPGPEGLAVLLLLRGGGRGGGLAPGLGALSSWVPSTARSGRQQRQNCRSQLPAPHRHLLPLPPPDPPPSPATHLLLLVSMATEQCSRRQPPSGVHQGTPAFCMAPASTWGGCSNFTFTETLVTTGSRGYSQLCRTLLWPLSSLSPQDPASRHAYQTL